MSASRPRFLLVSDDVDALAAMRAVCGDAEVVECGDALEARRLVASMWPAAVLVSEPRPGGGWLRTLPQSWHAVEGWELPTGVVGYTVTGDRP